jgi:Ca2+-binding EF-hand superfamily protein
LAGQHIPGIIFNQVAQKFDDDRDGKLSFQEFLNNIQKSLS